MPIYKMDGKKDGKQKYRVRINLVDSNGISRQYDRVIYGSEEAKELERTLNYSIKRDPPTSNKTIQELFDEYISVKKFEIRESTLDKSKRILEYHILPDLKEIKLSDLTLPLLQKWKTSMEEKGLALKTKQNVFSEFRALLNYAIKMDYILKNPLTKLGNFKDAYSVKKEINYYTAEEFKKFINEAKKFAQNSLYNIDWDYYVFFCIAFYTGLRKGEIHALKWSDIKDDYLTVSRSITQKLKGGDRETPPKNKSSFRTLQLPFPLIKVLNEHKERYKALDGFNDNFRICGGTKPIRDTSIQNANEKFAKLAGLKKIRIHDFRHSHASVLVNEGINIQEIARRLGHSRIEMTWNTYSHLYPREEERAVEILNKISL